MFLRKIQLKKSDIWGRLAFDYELFVIFVQFHTLCIMHFIAISSSIIFSSISQLFVSFSDIQLLILIN